MATETTLSDVFPLGSRLNERGRLEVGGCDTIELAKEFGTPAYVVAEEDLRARARAFVQAGVEAGHGDFHVVFALYLVLSGLERFLVEFIRRNKEVLVGLTAPQVESIVLLVLGLVWLGLMARGSGLNGLRARTSVPRPTTA